MIKTLSLMKKFIVTILFSTFLISASAQGAYDLKHEVKWNITNTIVFGSVEVGYEYFIDGNQSVGAEIFINDVYNFSIGRNIKDFNTNSFALNYNYYIAPEDNGAGMLITPFLKYRFGDYQEDAEPVVNMNSFILGIGAGYKWNLNDKFIFGPFANVARNFSNEVNDEFNIAVEFNAGFSIGYRF